jgi:type I restriction enzyme, S subunit
MNDLGWKYSLPNQWQTLEVRRLLQQGSAGIKIGPFGSELRLSDLSDSGGRVYGQENVIARDFTIGKRFVSGPKLSELSAYRVSPGDILVTMMGTSGRCAAVPVGAEHGIMDSHLLRLRFQDDEIDPRFAVWVLGESSIVREQFVVLGRGSIMHGLNSGIVKSVRLPVPSLAEQRAIADFLDRKTKALDDLIQKKERLIELLQQKRRTFITQAVTKGLDPTVPMQDCGIEWLGESPLHWEIRRIRHCTRVLRGRFSHRPRNDPRFYGGRYPFIQTGEVANAAKYIEEYHQTLNEDGYAISKEFPAGTLAMVITGAKTGHVAILRFSACFPDSIVGFVPNKRVIETAYLYHLLNAMLPELERISTVSTQENLNVDRISSLLVPCPSLEEQRTIITKLEAVVGTISPIEEKIQAQITLLGEYRQALISAAVTGKIDVTKETAC